MVTSLVALCVRQATGVVAIATGLLVIALAAVARLPVDVFPDLEGTRVTVLTEAPGNGAAIGGLKVTTDNGWFAARPSGTEAIYKIYTESFKGPDHLAQIQQEAQEIVSAAFKSAGV